MRHSRWMMISISEKRDYYKENGGVIFPNPNAPTGVEASQEMIEDILQHNQDVIVIIDEAYVDFGARTAQPLLEKYDKSDRSADNFQNHVPMAGMRIGYAMASPELIKYLNDVKYSFNSYTMDRTTLATGVAAIQDKAYFTETCEKIIATREWAKKELAALGFTFPDSKTNLSLLLTKAVRPKKFLRPFVRSIFM